MCFFFFTLLGDRLGTYQINFSAKLKVPTLFAQHDHRRK